MLSLKRQPAAMQRLDRAISAVMHLTLAAGSAGNAQNQPYNGPGAAAVRETGV